MSFGDDSIENRNKLTPILLVNPKNTELKEMLEQGTAAFQMVRSCYGNGGSDGDGWDTDIIFRTIRILQTTMLMVMTAIRMISQAIRNPL